MKDKGACHTTGDFSKNLFPLISVFSSFLKSIKILLMIFATLLNCVMFYISQEKLIISVQNWLKIISVKMIASTFIFVVFIIPEAWQVLVVMLFEPIYGRGTWPLAAWLWLGPYLLELLLWIFAGRGSAQYICLCPGYWQNEVHNILLYLYLFSENP